MKTRSVMPMRIAKTGYIVISAFLCILGLMCIVMPVLSAEILIRICGISLIVFGVIKLVGYFSKDLFRLAFQFDLEFGILLLVIGIVILLKPDSVAAFLGIVLGLVILADGLFKVQIAMDARRFGIYTWWLIMGLAVLTSFVGMLLVFHPAQSGRILMMLLGIALLFEGVLNLDVAISTVKIIRHQKPDVIEGDYYEIES